MTKVLWALPIVASVATLTLAMGQDKPGPSLSGVWNTAGNLGFAAVRASFAPPDEPLNKAAADWMVTDFINAEKWGSVGASCFAFDLGRFQGAAELARRTPTPNARQLWQQADQLHRDYRGAVQRSSCTLGLASAAELDSVYNSALFMGFATARASYFYSMDAPTPQQVVQQIAGDLAVVRSGFQVMQKCVAAAPLDNQLQQALRRLGSVPARESYTDMTALYIAIETALRSSTCAAPPITDRDSGGSCMQRRCAVECKDSVVLLGQVSGGPECQACLAKNCPQ